MQTHHSTIVPLPDNLDIRPMTLDDVPALVDIVNAIFAHRGQDRRTTEQNMRNDLQEPDFDITHSTRIVHTNEGQAVGYAIVYDTGKPPISNWLSVEVHPDYVDTVVGEHLMAWGLVRAQEAIVRCPDDARVIVRAGTLVGYTPDERLYEKMGMSLVRYFFRMLISMEEAPPTPVMPEGMSIRLYEHPQDLRVMVETFVESFRDHWGFWEEPIEDEIKFWKHHLENDSLFDPSLIFLAVDDATGEVGGLCLCRSEEWSDPKVAYVADLGVKRAYRKRGLALAMLHHAFGELWRRGRTGVSLYVDASSLTGATRLYERAGMNVHERSASYAYELRPGKDYTTQEAGD